MRDDQLLRYSRHILLNEWGVDGQERVSQSHALVVGAGGLGSPAALYLASAGVGQITLIDHDVVDVTNLQRQIAHTQDRVGQLKVESLKKAIEQINPEVQVQCIAQRADSVLLNHHVALADVVLDCTDNFETRHAINLACVQHNKPLVSGSALRMDGQVAVYDIRQSQAPCYACVFPPTQQFEETRCATMGVLAPLVGIIGSLQATEALKILSGMGASLTGQLILFNAQFMEWQTLQTHRHVQCPVCSAHRS
ncbi:HesA/MoeB/ThiF family protein [Limnohabitans sp. Rim11]|jgi:molybdopterin/thiamine biosynthesis adenylyltransferase|uniref:HesA/MoeB/ThiF family protein n=1 Tax=Limnohabitans sp. Rim11 TaxID=1100719 RepID=UPI000A55E187|nr:HesA/MoeB/ThiF family protein [Limnohabitans sp. Rim11]